MPHVKNTGEIGFIKNYIRERGIAGVSRIEAVASVFAENYVSEQFTALNGVKTVLKNSERSAKHVSGFAGRKRPP